MTTIAIIEIGPRPTIASTPAGIHELALAAAQAGAEAEDARLGPEAKRGFDCGFAWVQFPGTGAFAKWSKANARAAKHWHRGLYIWGSGLHTLSTQSISVHEAACREYSRVLRDHGIDASTGSRLD